MTATFYNEHDPFAAAWLRSLGSAGHIAEGVVDERSVADLKASDLEPFDRAHFFAGLGGWDHALRLAGWPEDAPVWTGSCPCQPFSTAGKRKGTDDVRHLWPIWFKLIAERMPPVVFGEQVSSPDGLRWFDAVSADLEAAGYAVGALDTCAAGIGAPHLRQRLYFVAVADGGSRDLHLSRRESERAVLDASGNDRVGGMAGADGRVSGDGRLQRSGEHGLVATDGGTRGMADAHEDARGQGREVGGRSGRRGVEESRPGPRGVGEFGLVGDPDGSGRNGLYERNEPRHVAPDSRRTGPWPVSCASSGAPNDSGLVGDSGGARGGRHAGAVPRTEGEGEGEGCAARRVADEPLASGDARRVGDSDEPGPQGWRVGRDGAGERPPRMPVLGGFWRDAEWLYCRDGKWRATQPGVHPLAHGFPNRVGLLRGAGNAIVPQQAAAFVTAFMQTRGA